MFEFSRTHKDMIRFTHDDAVADATDITLHTVIRDNDNGPNKLHVFKMQRQEDSLLAVIRDVASDFDLTDNYVLENASIDTFVPEIS